MKIALAQLNYTVGDIKGNAAKIITAVERAKDENADVVIFAELALSGTPAYDLLRKTTFIGECEEHLQDIAEHCQSICAIIGIPILASNGCESGAVVIKDGEIIDTVTKHFITARREMGFINPGTGYQVIDISGEKVAIVVGDDLRRLTQIEEETSYIINLNSRRYGTGAFSERYTTLRNIAKMQSKNIILVNQIGCNGEIVYDGTSSVVNPQGQPMMILKSFEEDFGVYDTEVAQTPVDVPIELYSHNRTGMNYKAAVLGIRDFFHKSGYKKACIGLSGGIDSSIVACLAVAALGKENVHGLMMPSEFSSDLSVDDAVELADKLGIKYTVIPITNAYNAITSSLESLLDKKFSNTEENIQTRIRTIFLMALQNEDGYVLLNSSNKSENALGMCTLYGDTAGAFSPTGDLYKTEMYELARYINNHFDDLIPENIMTKEPSSELHPNQKDSDFLPPYDVVDAILIRMIERSQHREEIINAGFDSKIVEKIHNMVMNNEKKRYQFPPVLRLSSSAFKHEWLLPLINKYSM